MIWTATDHGMSRGVTREHLGFIPMFISDFDERSVKEQIDENYRHGGGWRPLQGWVMDRQHVLRYQPGGIDSGDPPLHPLFTAEHGDEKLFFYDHAWLAVVSANGNVEVSRLD